MAAAAAEAVVIKAAEARGTRRLLLLAPHGSYRIAPFVEAARALGLSIVIASESRLALADPWTEALRVDFSTPVTALADLLAYHEAAPISAVIGTDDHSTELAALLSQRLGLPHNPLPAVQLARRKDLARARLWEHGLPVPRHWVLDRHAPLRPQMRDITYPAVVKPVALSASRGVIRVDTPEELLTACARIGKMLSEVVDLAERGRLLVEGFVPGAEIAVEGLLSDGVLSVLAIFDKPDPLDGPYFEETYYVTPSRHPQALRHEVQRTLQAACRAYGLREGPIHAECRLNAQGVMILEVAARTIGGLCGRLLRFGTGMGLEELVLRHALGAPLDQAIDQEGAGVLMIPIPRAGVLSRVEGVLAAERVPYVSEVHIAVREGYELVPLPEGASYLGFIFARAPSAAEAENALRTAHACLNVVVNPLWRLERGG